MTKLSTRLFIIASLLILTSIACNFPLLERIQSILPSDITLGRDSTAPSNTDGAELTYIPAAAFQMGSVTSDLLASEDEMPQHQVDVDGFYIYTHEVTNQMYAACINTGGCMGVETLDSGPTSRFDDPEFQDHPVVGVDWVMARNYCSWAGGRLPTEAEWELASRGPESLLYPWGDEDPTCDYVNMGGCAIPPDTQQVGHYLMGNSPDGVWDLSGNVWEWVHDWYADDYYAKSSTENPVGPLDPQDPEKPLRVIRGGGLYSEPVRMRSAARLGLNPYRVFDDVGFRCVAEGGLNLPAAYDPGEDRHERVPPSSADGGDRAEDPEDGSNICSMKPGIGTCPNEEGIIQIIIPCYCTNPSTWSALNFIGEVFDPHCSYNETLEIATCTGPAPLNYLTIPPDNIQIILCFDNHVYARCFPAIPHSKPTDCFTVMDGFLRVTPHCLEIDGVITPVVILNISFPDGDFERATADGTPLTCEPLPGEDEFFRCHGLPGSPGDELEIIAFHSSGGAMTRTTTFPDCSGPVDFEDPWVLAEVGCLSATEYYAVIDTFRDVEFTEYRLEGVDAPYICREVESRAGRWYCNFPLANWYTSLTFCVEIAGEPGETCETFDNDDFGERLPDTCAVPDDSDFDCSDFTDQDSCEAHGCTWSPNNFCTD